MMTVIIVLKSFVKSSGEINIFHSHAPNLTPFFDSNKRSCDMLQKQDAKNYYALFILIKRE